MVPGARTSRPGRTDGDAAQGATVVAAAGAARTRNRSANASVARALRLARYFGTSAEFWLNLQSYYELDLAKDRVGDEIAAIAPLQSIH